MISIRGHGSSILGALIGLIVCHSQGGTRFEGFLVASAGETVRSINEAGSPLTGIYHIGAKGSLASTYWDAGLLLEAGVFNEYPAMGAAVEGKAHHEVWGNKARLGLGMGASFQSYYRGNYRGYFSEPQGYTFRTVPMIVGQLILFERLLLEYQKDLDDAIFWKARVGWRFTD